MLDCSWAWTITLYTNVYNTSSLWPLLRPIVKIMARLLVDTVEQFGSLMYLRVCDGFPVLQIGDEVPLPFVFFTF